MRILGLCLLTGLSLSACVTINAPTDNTGSTSNNMTTQYPVEKALLNIYTQPRSETLYAVDGNEQLISKITVTPKGFISFEGRQLQAAETAYSTTVNGKLTNQFTSLNYFTLNPAKFYGFTNSAGQYSVATQTTTLPKMAKVGSASELITENVYRDSSKRQQVSMFTQGWTLSQASNDTAWFCLNTSADLLPNSNPVDNSSHCYTINAQGDILDSKLTINESTAKGIKTINYVRR